MSTFLHCSEAVINFGDILPDSNLYKKKCETRHPLNLRLEEYSKAVFSENTTKSCIAKHVYMKLESSSSCRAANTDIPDPLSPLLPIIHRLWQVF